MTSGPASKGHEVEVGGRRLRVTNLDKVLWPETGFTKGDVVAYYQEVAPALLPHLSGRPVTLHRFPDGVGGAHWYETRCPPHPPWLRVARMHAFRRSGKVVDACVIDDRAGLAWAAQMAAVEIHPYLASPERPDHPGVAVFDLDPGPPASIIEACRAALDVRAVLDDLGLVSVVKTSGAKGLHVYVPVDADHTFTETKAFARAIAGLLVHRHPERFVDSMNRSLRTGKVFVDWGQNDPGKSTVVTYSLRAMAVPTVSIPLRWDEVELAAAGRGHLLWFSPTAALRRVEVFGDLFAPALGVAQQLPVIELA